MMGIKGYLISANRQSYGSEQHSQTYKNKYKFKEKINKLKNLPNQGRVMFKR